MINAGELTARIQIQSPTITQDSLGGASRAYATAYTRWAQYRPTSGGERTAFDTDQSMVHADFIALYDSTLFGALNNEMRILYDGDGWEITSWRRHRAESHYIIITATLNQQ